MKKETDTKKKPGAAGRLAAYLGGGLLFTAGLILLVAQTDTPEAFHTRAFFWCKLAGLVCWAAAAWITKGINEKEGGR